VGFNRNCVGCLLCESPSCSDSWLVIVRPKLLSYLLHVARVLREKLTGSKVVKKFPAFYGTRRTITAFTSVRHLSLSWARSIQSIPTHPTSGRSILILSFPFTPGVVSFHQVSPSKSSIHFSSAPYMLHTLPILVQNQSYTVASVSVHPKILPV
jgi:hypothetical protein